MGTALWFLVRALAMVVFANRYLGGLVMRVIRRASWDATADDYRPSDMAWMDMKTNPVDIVIGPIETYEDQLYGYKAAYEIPEAVADYIEWLRAGNKV